MADEELRLRAIVEDRVTTEVRNMLTGLRRGGQEVSRGADESTKHVGTQSEAFKKLREVVGEGARAFREELLPGLERTALALGGGRGRRWRGCGGSRPCDKSRSRLWQRIFQPSPGFGRRSAYGLRFDYLAQMTCSAEEFAIPRRA